MKSILSLFILLTCPLYVSAQQQFTTGWQINYAVHRNNFQQTTDGGYILCGTFEYPATTTAQCYLMKIGPNGHQQWMRQFPIASFSFSNISHTSVCQTQDGGYAIATSYYTGSSASNSTKSIYLVRTDSLGNFIWSRMYPGAGDSYAMCIGENSDRGFIIAGTTTDTVNQLNYAYLLRTDSVGGVLWGTCYWPQNDSITPACYMGARFYSASQASDGGFIVSGVMNANSTHGSVVLKTDGYGTVLWCQANMLTGPDYAFDLDVRELSNGDFIACGEDQTAQYYATLTRFSASGVPLWRKTYGSTDQIAFWSRNVANSIVETPDGFTLSVGEFVSPGDHTRMVHTDTAGNPVWTRRYTMTSGGAAADLEYTTDGGYAFATYTPTVFAMNQLLLYKTDSLGAVSCDDYVIPDTVCTLTLPVSRSLSTMNIAPSSVVPTTLSPVTLPDSIFCANENTIGIPEAFTAHKAVIFPNPAQQEVNMMLNNLNGNLVRVRMFDQLGQEVAVQSSGSAYGTLQMRFDIRNMAPGMYFVAVEVDGVSLSVEKVLISE